MGKPLGSGDSVVYLLQFLPRSQDAADHPGDGIRHHGSRFGASAKCSKRPDQESFKIRLDFVDFAVDILLELGCMGWIYEEAKMTATFLRDGKELWRRLRDQVKADVEEWVGIYNKPNTPEIAFSDCREVTENCFRVRTIPAPGETERYLELAFNPRTGELKTSGEKPDRSYCCAADPEGKLTIQSVPPSAAFPNGLSLQGVSKDLLKPFIEELGWHEPINIKLKLKP